MITPIEKGVNTGTLPVFVTGLCLFSDIHLMDSVKFCLNPVFEKKTCANFELKFQFSGQVNNYFGLSHFFSLYI